MTITAIYENGVFRPVKPVEIPDNSEVEISVLSTKPCGVKSTLAELAEIAYRYPENPDAPSDGAAQHDHYLYGAPKRP